MSTKPITIRSLGPEDGEVLERVRPGTFDNPVDPAAAWAFLATRVNDIVVALDAGEVIGFVSGTTLMHPDKPMGFFINELSVHKAYRRQRIGSRLLSRILELARDRGCVDIWLASDADNEAANAFFAASGGQATTRAQVYAFPDTWG